jgi:hypothetical protein
MAATDIYPSNKPLTHARIPLGHKPNFGKTMLNLTAYLYPDHVQKQAIPSPIPTTKLNEQTLFPLGLP